MSCKCNERLRKKDSFEVAVIMQVNKDILETFNGHELERAVLIADSNIKLIFRTIVSIELKKILTEFERHQQNNLIKK